MFYMFEAEKYGNLLTEHWSDRAKMTKEVLKIGFQSPQKEEVKSDTIRCAEIIIEEITGPLAGGAKTRRSKDIFTTSPIYRTSNRSTPYFNKHIDCAQKDKDGNLELLIEYYCNKKDIDGPVWCVLHAYGLTLLNVGCSCGGEAKYVKLKQWFRVKVYNEFTIPYIQLLCNIKEVKYNDNWFRKGDIITLFVLSGNEIYGKPFPPLLTIRPTENQYYVPMEVGQQLSVITDSTQKRADNAHDKFASIRAIRHVDTHQLTSPAAKLIGEKVVSEIFHCIEQPKISDFIFVDSTSGLKTICIPTIISGWNETQANGKYALITNPANDFIIYASNINGFVVRSSNKKTNFRVDKSIDYIVKVIYSIDNPGYREIKVKIIRPQAFLFVERRQDDWVVK